MLIPIVNLLQLIIKSSIGLCYIYIGEKITLYFCFFIPKVMAYLSYNHFEVQVIVLIDCVKLASDTW